MDDALSAIKFKIKHKFYNKPLKVVSFYGPIRLYEILQPHIFKLIFLTFKEKEKLINLERNKHFLYGGSDFHWKYSHSQQNIFCVFF